MGRRKLSSQLSLSPADDSKAPIPSRTTPTSRRKSAEIAATAETGSPAENLPHPPVELVRVGKDEMNLVEYPFATLQHAASPDAFIERQWEAEHPITRRTLKASWRVTGDPILGLPTPTEERLFLVLMELAREAEWSEDIYFTRYGLIQRLGWPDNAKSYSRLTEGFRRLTAVTITSENAFWNPGAKAFHNRGFHILEAYEIVAEPPGRKKKVGADLPLSHFRWSREMRDSFAAGYIRSLDLGIALTLLLPLSARLFRYLDKKKYDGKSFFDIEVRRLCEIHLGMTPTKHASTLKVRLQPAHEELLTRGIVQGVQYLPMKTKSAEKVRYLFLPPDAPKTTAPTPQNPSEIQSETVAQAPEAPQMQLALDEPDASTKEIPDADALLARMTALGVSPAIASRLAQDASPQNLALQLDCLADRRPKDPAATFVAAARGGWAPPVAFTARQEARRGQEAAEQQKRRKTAQKREIARLEAESEASEQLENAELDERFQILAPEAQNEIESEIRNRMQFVLLHLGQEAAQNGWAATRRQILREWDEQKKLESAPTDALQSPAPRANHLEHSEAEIEAILTRLPPSERETIENECQIRLESSGLGHLAPGHAARAGVRRTVLRETLKNGQINDENEL